MPPWLAGSKGKRGKARASERKRGKARARQGKQGKARESQRKLGIASHAGLASLASGAGRKEEKARERESK